MDNGVVQNGDAGKNGWMDYGLPPTNQKEERKQVNYGIHTDIPASEYHAHPAASASKLKKLWSSTPAHLKADTEAFEPSAAMIMGTLAHSLILEPETPLPGIVVQPDEYEPGKKWTRAAKVCKEWEADQKAKGLLVLKADEWKDALGMAEAVAWHPLAHDLLVCGKPEVSLCAHDSANGLDIKARIDFLPNSGGAIVDVKTTVDASERGFMRRAYDLGYHIQAALYLDLWNALMPTEPRTEFYFIAVENFAPYAVNVFKASAEFLSKGREDYKAALTLYAACVKADNWPAYSQEVKELGLPKYAI